MTPQQPRGKERRSVFRDSPSKARFTVGAMALVAWISFAAQGLTPIQALVDVLRDIVLGTIFYHAVMTQPPKE